MADDKLKQRAREVAWKIGAASEWHSKPCVGCEENVEAIATFAAELVAEARVELASERRYSSEELRMALADMRLETLEEAAQIFEAEYCEHKEPMLGTIRGLKAIRAKAAALRTPQTEGGL